MGLLGGVGRFLLGSPGGIDKDVKAKLQAAYGKYQDETPDAAYLDFIRRQVEPGFKRARENVAGQYANADAPISSGGRTQAEIGLAGQEQDVLGGLVQDERKRKAELARYYLQLLMQGTNRAPTQGFLGAAAGAAGAFFGSKAGAKPGRRVSPGVQAPDEGYPVYG